MAIVVVSIGAFFWKSYLNDIGARPARPDRLIMHIALLLRTIIMLTMFTQAYRLIWE